MTLQTLPPMDETANWQAISDFHTERLMAYAKKKGMTKDQAENHLLALHRQGVNIAMHISNVLMQSHDAYVKQLTDYGENTMFIR